MALHLEPPKPWLEPGAGELGNQLKEGGVAPAQAAQAAAAVSVAISIRRIADGMVSIMEEAAAIMKQERKREEKENAKRR